MKRLLGLIVMLTCCQGLFGAIYLNDFVATRDMSYGRGTYNPNTNYGNQASGLVGNQNLDGFLVDVNRPAIMSWLTQAFGHAPTPVEIRHYARLTLYLTPSFGWEDTSTPPTTVFGQYFRPGVRLSSGQDWSESTGTFNNAAPGSPWHSQTGADLPNIYGTSGNPLDNMVLNKKSETWGQADTLGGGSDYYGYGTSRPWVLDPQVGYRFLTDPAAVGLQLVPDYQNKPWTSGNDVCLGQVYTREMGLSEYQPYVEVMRSSTLLVPFMPADIDQDDVVSFADYLILEANFGKTGLHEHDTADINHDGKVAFDDYLILEANFGKSFVPEPCSLLLLALLGLMRRRR